MAVLVQNLAYGTLFLLSITLLLTILVPKGAIGAIFVFVIQLLPIIWSRRFQMVYEVSVTHQREDSQMFKLTPEEPEITDMSCLLRHAGLTNSTAFLAQ